MITGRTADQGRAQFRLIADSFSAGLPIYLVGGYAYDALLAGASTRLHHDVDLMVWRRDAPAIARAYRQFGFKVLAPNQGGGAVRAVGVLGPDLRADMALVDQDADRGRGYLLLHGARGRRFRFHLPPDTFEYAPQRLGDLMVRTASPLFLIQVRAALTAAMGRSPAREPDERAYEALRARFFPDRGLDDPLFQPEMLEVAG